MVRVIGVNDTYNTNQNLFDVSYWSDYSAETGEMTLNVILNSQIEMNVVGTVVV